MSLLGFPHSEIPGSKVICTSPRLIAAYRVLHRFPEPRHPPCALRCLTSISSFPPRGLRFQVYSFRFVVNCPANLSPKTLNLPRKIAGWVVFNPSGFRGFQAVQASQTDLHVNDPSLPPAAYARAPPSALAYRRLVLPDSLVKEPLDSRSGLPAQRPACCPASSAVVRLSNGTGGCTPPLSTSASPAASVLPLSPSLVENAGIEPATSCVQGRRSPN
jgi:hypothetical protein